MKKLSLTVPTLLGTESIIAGEIKNLGYEPEEICDGKVTFTGDAEAICIANINLRSAERVMIKMAEFPARTFEELFEGVKRIGWEDFVDRFDAFPVKGHSLKSQLSSVPACQAIIKKAIVSRLSEVYGITGTFEETGALFPIQFALFKDICTVYIDTSGSNLYKRGYRTESVLAPMRETLAFSMVDMSFWRGDRPFLDPFCGSGTIPIEAALYAVGKAPGIKRKFVAETWRNIIPQTMWRDAREEAEDNIHLDTPTEIYASDIDPEAIEIAKQNARNAGVFDKIRFEVCDMAKAKTFKSKGVIVCNPPYGERLLDMRACESLYRAMGKKFHEYSEAKKYILTSHEGFERFFGKAADKKRKVYNGMLKCYIYQYFKQ